MAKQSGQGRVGSHHTNPKSWKKTTRLDHSRQIIGYVTQWDAWKDGGDYVLKGGFNHLNVDYTQYTIVNFSFFGLAKDGSLHGGDFRNKQIYQETEEQEPAALINEDIYSSFDMQMLYGKLLSIYWISQGDYAYGLGYRNNSDDTGWVHSASGRSGPWPLVLADPNPGKGKSIFTIAKEHGVKVMASLGGWSMSKHFPEMALDTTKRNRFLQDVDVLMEMGFDGIDIDWEYPNAFGMNIYKHSEADYASFADLMDAIRERIGKDKLITAAMSASPANLVGFDWSRLNASMDYFNMMTYDFNGGWSDVAGHNSPLYDYPGGPSNFSVNACVQALRSYGADMRKVCIGGAFYGRGVITNGPAALNAPTVKRPIVIDPDGPIETSADYDNWGNAIPTLDFAGTPNYGYIRKVTGDGTWTDHWDDVAKVPYMTKSNYFLSYDNERSIREKAKYIKEHDLAGIIIWQTWGDMENLITNTETVGEAGQKLVISHDRTSPLVVALNDELAKEDSGTPTGIRLDSPTEGQVFTAPASVPLRATMIGGVSGVSFVRFFHGGAKIEDVTTPNGTTYEYMWTGLAAGVYQNVRAMAVLENGDRLNTEYVTFRVGEGGSPTGIEMTSPKNGETYPPGDVLLQATLQGGTQGVDFVRFFHGGTKIIDVPGGDTLTYEHTWNVTAAGSYAVRAVAFMVDATRLNTEIVTFRIVTDDESHPGSASDAVSVSLSHPVNGWSYVTGTEMEYKGNASSTAGNIVKMEIFNSDGYLLAARDGAGSVIGSHLLVVAGIYHVYLQATDDQGNVGRSELRTFTVTSQAGSETSIYFIKPSQDEDHDISEGIELVPFITLNPISLFPTEVKYWQQTPEEGAVVLGTVTSAPYLFLWKPEKPGTYEIMAELTLNTTSKEYSDWFAFRTIGGGGEVKGIRLEAPRDGQEFMAPASVLLRAVLTSEARKIPNLEVNYIRFFHGSTKIEDVHTPEADGYTYQCQWENVPAGEYRSIRAVAILSDNTRLDSENISFHVLESVGVPTGIQLDSPKEGEKFPAPATVPLRAKLVGGNSGVDMVRFLEGGTKIIDLEAPPYEYEWSRPNPGPYRVRAIAFLSDGNRLESDMISFVVS